MTGIDSAMEVNQQVVLCIAFVCVGISPPPFAWASSPIDMLYSFKPDTQITIIDGI